MCLGGGTPSRASSSGYRSTAASHRLSCFRGGHGKGNPPYFPLAWPIPSISSSAAYNAVERGGAGVCDGRSSRTERLADTGGILILSQGRYPGRLSSHEPAAARGTLPPHTVAAEPRSLSLVHRGRARYEPAEQRTYVLRGN